LPLVLDGKGYFCAQPLLFLAALPANMRTKKKTISEGKMRKVGLIAGATVTAIAMTFSGMGWAQPLAPGKPAGVHAAQLGDKELLVFGAIGVTLAAVLIANSSDNNHAASATQPITIVTPTTT
jgi:hypothetical protein